MSADKYKFPPRPVLPHDTAVRRGGTHRLGVDGRCELCARLWPCRMVCDAVLWEDEPGYGPED